MSKIHQHDYACATVHARCLLAPDRTCNTTGERTRPRYKLCLARARPRLSAPQRILQRATPSNCDAQSSNLGTGSVATSSGPSPRPSLVLPSISVTEDAPNVIRYSEADTFLKKLFPILSTVSTTTVWATPPQGAQVHDQALGLGSQQETNKHKSTTKYKPCCLQDTKTLSTAGRQPLSTRSTPLRHISRVVYGFSRGQANTSQSSPPFGIGTCLNHTLGLEVLPLSLSL
jgi:hypothetical protein